MREIPTEPLKPSVCSEGTFHPLRETSFGLVFEPSRFPLWFGIAMSPLVPVAWNLASGLGIDPGLKLAIWLFPLFAATGSLVGWMLMRLVFARIRVDVRNRRIDFGGLRFRGEESVSLDQLVAVQVCYGGVITFKTGQGSSSLPQEVPVWELNLAVTENEDLRRVNLFCHGQGKILLEQGRTIARRLDLPLVTAGRVPR